MNALTKQRRGAMAQLIPPFADATPTSLSLPEDLPEHHWVEVGEVLGRARSASQWWIGDWWAFGEHRYGERKAIVEADDWEGPAFQTCANAATVCRAFETSSREEVVSFRRHQAIAVIHDEEWRLKVLAWAATPDEHGKRPTYAAVEARVKEVKAHLSQGWTPDQLDRKARAEAGGCVVANMRDDGTGKRVDEALLCWAEMEDRFVRIDRASKWGNPFEMPEDGARPDVVGNYTKFYLPHKPGLLRRMDTLGGKVCGCWCHPEECHGHVIAEIVNRVIQGESPETVVDELAGADG
jgi:hypothetical protein